MKRILGVMAVVGIVAAGAPYGSGGAAVAAQEKSAQPPAPLKAPAKPATPAAALAAVKAAMETGDVVAFAELISGAPGVTLRKLAGPLKKAQEASAKLDQALSEKPALGLVNPFLHELDPLRGFQLEALEVVQEGGRHLARIRFGRTGHLKEETVGVVQEDGKWRVSLPGEHLKSVQRLTPERLTRQIETLTKLADILTKVAGEVAAGKFASKEAVLIRLADAVREAKVLGEGLGR